VKFKKEYGESDERSDFHCNEVSHVYEHKCPKSLSGGLESYYVESVIKFPFLPEYKNATDISMTIEVTEEDELNTFAVSRNLLGKAATPFTCESTFLDSEKPYSCQKQSGEDDPQKQFAAMKMKFPERKKKLGLVDWLNMQRFEGKLLLEKNAGFLQIRFVSWNIFVETKSDLGFLVSKFEDTELPLVPLKKFSLKCSCDFCEKSEMKKNEKEKEMKRIKNLGSKSVPIALQRSEGRGSEGVSECDIISCMMPSSAGLQNKKSQKDSEKSKIYEEFIEMAFEFVKINVYSGKYSELEKKCVELQDGAFSKEEIKQLSNARRRVRGKCKCSDNCDEADSDFDH